MPASFFISPENRLSLPQPDGAMIRSGQNMLKKLLSLPVK